MEPQGSVPQESELWTGKLFYEPPRDGFPFPACIAGREPKMCAGAGAFHGRTNQTVLHFYPWLVYRLYYTAWVTKPNSCNRFIL